MLTVKRYFVAGAAGALFGVGLHEASELAVTAKIERSVDTNIVAGVKVNINQVE